MINVPGFMAQAITWSPLSVTTVRDLRARYVAWCVEQNVIPASSHVLNGYLRQAGFVNAVARIAGKNAKVWKGMKLAS